MVESASSNILSLVTARAGSKRLPNKNILDLNGKKLFEYTIEYSNKLGVYTVVSTDSEVIIDYCKRKDIKYIRRDYNLSKDDTKIEDVIYDACKRLGEYKYISLLYANIPTRYPDEFFKAQAILENESYDCVMSFKSIEHCNPEVAFPYNDDMLPKQTVKEYMGQNRKKFMIHDGHTILFKMEYFIEYMQQQNKGPSYLYQQFGRKIKPLIHDNIVIDIDNINDFKLVEGYLK